MITTRRDRRSALALRPSAAWLVWGLACAGCSCDRAPTVGPANTAASDPGVPGGAVQLSAEQAQRVLAKVGDRVITLADYQLTLERMDRFERLRYQTPERRRLLLDELINVELLAREAERRGLDKSPEAQAELRILKREEARRRLRATLPSAEALPVSEVRAHYDAHQEQFKDPERRRVAVIRLGDAATAERVLVEAKAASPEQWGDLARKHSTLPSPSGQVSKTEARPPREFEGDLGLVSAPDQPRGENPLVPEPVRKAVFELGEQGAVLPRVVAHAGHFYIVRLLAKSPARQRSFAEAEATLRVQLLQQKYRQAEDELVAQLQRTLPVVVNEEALKQLAATP